MLSRDQADFWSRYSRRSNHRNHANYLPRNKRFNPRRLNRIHVIRMEVTIHVVRTESIISIDSMVLKLVVMVPIPILFHLVVRYHQIHHMPSCDKL